MAVVAIVGPSHSGKSTLLSRLSHKHTHYRFQSRLTVLDLDERLGSSHRSDHRRAIDLVRSQAGRVNELVLVNVGAGQIVQSAFRDFLRTADDMVTIAVWCDETTFRSRHAPDTADREVLNNYSDDLLGLWEDCRSHERLVDTSSPRTIDDCCADLARVLERVASSMRPWEDRLEP